MKNIMKYISNIALITGAVIGVYTLADIYLLRRRLPPGVCPVTENKPLLYIAIALCCIAFALSFFEPKGAELKE